MAGTKGGKHKSAISGKFVTAKHAAASPKTTYKLGGKKK